jgi:hypothetical protein
MTTRNTGNGYDTTASYWNDVVVREEERPGNSG